MIMSIYPMADIWVCKIMSIPDGRNMSIQIWVYPMDKCGYIKIGVYPMDKLWVYKNIGF